MKMIDFGQPCRNFCFMGANCIPVVDGGKDKFVCCSLVTKGTGVLLLVDPETGKAEGTPLPDENGAWGLISADENTVLVGSCLHKGAVFVYDIPSRKFTDEYSVPGETYIWNLVRASDGRFYGGTYNGCKLLRFDYQKGELTDLGRMSPHFKNLYAREVYADERGDGNLMVSCISDRPDTVIYNIYKEKIVTVLPGALKRYNFDVLQVGDKFYSRADFSEIGESADMTGARAAGVIFPCILRDGTEVKISNAGFTLIKDGVSVEKTFDHTAPPTSILGLCESDGTVWGSSGLGQTIFSVDVQTLEYKNYPPVYNGNGEVYGIRVIGGRVFCTSYPSAYTTVFDPQKPWETGKNPAIVAEAKGMCRPEAKSEVGPDGRLWTGWWTVYGEYGGALSRLDPVTYEQKVFENPLSKQGIDLLCAGGKYIYFITGNKGNGLPSQNLPIHLGCMDTEGALVSDFVWEEGDRPCKPAFLEGRLYVPVLGGNPRVVIFSEGLESCSVVKTGWALHTLVALPGRKMLLASGSEGTFLMDREGNLAEKLNGRELRGHWYVAAGEVIYYAHGLNLYKIIL